MDDAAAAVITVTLERYAASFERENEPLWCETSRTSPTGVHATPRGQWQFTPCGHGTDVA